MALKIPFTEISLSLRVKKNKQSNNKFDLDSILKKIEHFQKSDSISFKHSGTLGDIIYAIPVMKRIAEGRKIKLFIEINRYSDDLVKNHYLKGVMMNKESISLLAPLLESQDIEVAEFNGEDVIDLDVFRDTGFPLHAGHIGYWYHYAFVVEYNIWDPWLSVPRDETYKDSIVIARSERYNNKNIDYSFLSSYPNLIFLGLPDEYEKLNLKNAQFHRIKNFLEAAVIINSCKFFISNQTFLSTLAEALKVPRILECCVGLPIVTPLGGKGYSVCYQSAFVHACSILSS